MEKIEFIKQEFPFFIKNKEIIYLDNASTTQKPKKVIKKITDFYSKYNCNIGRSVNNLSSKVSELIEESRNIVAQHINCNFEEILFTKGTTDSINLSINSFFYNLLKKDDVIILSITEHSSNFLPWIELAKKKKAKIKLIKINEKGELDKDHYLSILDEKVKIIALTHGSNVNGSLNDIEFFCKKARENKSITLIDAAQTFAHSNIDIKKIDCDFLAASSHKSYGPMGIGILFVKKDHIDNMKRQIFGGGITNYYDFEKVDFVEGLASFEVGTQDLGGIIGFAEALKFIKEIGIDDILKHEKFLIKTLNQELKSIDRIKIFNLNQDSLGICSFFVEGISSFDLGLIFSTKNIIIRHGKLCCSQFLSYFGVEDLIRVSFAIYSDLKDLEIFLNTLKYILKKY